MFLQLQAHSLMEEVEVKEGYLVEEAVMEDYLVEEAN